MIATHKKGSHVKQFLLGNKMTPHIHQLPRAGYALIALYSVYHMSPYSSEGGIAISSALQVPRPRKGISSSVLLSVHVANMYGPCAHLMLCRSEIHGPMIIAKTQLSSLVGVVSEILRTSS